MGVSTGAVNVIVCVKALLVSTKVAVTPFNPSIEATTLYGPPLMALAVNVVEATPVVVVVAGEVPATPLAPDEGGVKRTLKQQATLP